MHDAAVLNTLAISLPVADPVKTSGMGMPVLPEPRHFFVALKNATLGLAHSAT
jgi:hypothetical protein